MSSGRTHRLFNPAKPILSELKKRPVGYGGAFFLTFLVLAARNVPFFGQIPVFYGQKFDEFPVILPVPDEFSEIRQESGLDFVLVRFVLKFRTVLHEPFLHLYRPFFGRSGRQIERREVRKRLYQVGIHHVFRVSLMDELEELEIDVEHLVFEYPVQLPGIREPFRLERLEFVAPELELEPRQLGYPLLLEPVQPFFSLDAGILDFVVDSDEFPRVLLRILPSDFHALVFPVHDVRLESRPGPLFKRRYDDFRKYVMRIDEHVQRHVHALETRYGELCDGKEFQIELYAPEHEPLAGDFVYVAPFRASGVVPLPYEDESEFRIRRDVDDFEILVVFSRGHLRKEIDGRLLVVLPEVRIAGKAVEDGFLVNRLVDVGLDIVDSEPIRLPAFEPPHFSPL